MDFNTENIVRYRYMDNLNVQRDSFRISTEHRGDLTELAMMPIIAFNNKTVQYANLRTLRTISTDPLIEKYGSCKYYNLQCVLQLHLLARFR